MIKKLGIVAGTGALLLAAAVPSLALTLPNINGQVNYVNTQSAATANTGFNDQLVSGNTGGSVSGYFKYSRHGGNNEQESRTSANMETGNAFAMSHSTVDIKNTLNVTKGESRDKGRYGHYNGSSGNETGINVQANVVLGGSTANANTGDNIQRVGGSPELFPSLMSNGYDHRGSNGSSSTTQANMETGDAKAMSHNEVKLVSALNVTSSNRSHR